MACSSRPSAGAEIAATLRQAAALLEALPITERALGATAFYAALRRGQVRALLWEDVDLGRGVGPTAGAANRESRATRGAVSAARGR